MGRLARWRSRRTVLIGAAVVLAVLVAGFAVALARSGGDRGGSAPDGAVAPAAPGLSRATGSGGDARSAGAPSVGEAVADAKPGTSAGAPLATDLATAGATPQAVPVGGVARSLVRTAQVTLEVTDPAAGVRQVHTAALAAGGLVAEEQSGALSGWVVLRVPADGLDRLVEQVAAFGKVIDRSTRVEDATEQVVDLDARVASQQASVARVRALLAQAESIGDVVTIESELARREAELDSLTGRLTELRDQVELSTLTVELRTAGLPTADDGRPADFADGLAAGWDGLRTFGAATGVVIGFLLPFLPVLAALGGIAWLAWRIVRARRAPLPAGAGGGSGPGAEGES